MFTVIKKEDFTVSNTARPNKGGMRNLFHLILRHICLIHPSRSLWVTGMFVCTKISASHNFAKIRHNELGTIHAKIYNLVHHLLLNYKNHFHKVYTIYYPIC